MKWRWPWTDRFTYYYGAAKSNLVGYIKESHSSQMIKKITNGDGAKTPSQPNQKHVK